MARRSRSLEEQTALRLTQLEDRRQHACLSCRYAQVRGFYVADIPRVVCALDRWQRDLPLPALLRGNLGEHCADWTE